ncbi:MAG: tRNA (guanosine(46)-N7)-methyltransferase TrmB [Solobacterium sp.]|nr:tRNA (guanosine(46)-N7)-methyltransferase TrmB [Solobacterium sp.]
MRMRKKKWAQPYIEEHGDYIYENPVDLKGKWRQLLKCDTLHLEIGMGKGDYLIGMSGMYPEEGWIGVEKDSSAAAVAARKMIESGLDRENSRMIAGDAENLTDWFAPGEINMIHLNFSDPWPKKRAHKKRLSSKHFLEIYDCLLAENGTVRMKTDNTGLFEDSVLYFLNNGFTLTEFSADYRRSEHPEDAVTEYEGKFMALGQPIYMLKAIRCSDVIK